MNRTRLILASAGALATVALASGCAAGQDAATLQIKTNFAAGSTPSGILAQNIVVVVDPSTGAAQLTGTLINTGTANDQLTGVSIDGKAVATPIPVGLQSQESVNLATPEGVRFVVPSASGAKPGINSTVDLTFAAGGSIQLQADTQANQGIYAQFTPSATGAAAS